MRRIDKVSTDNPKLLKKELKNGTYSLYLEYYLGYSKSVDSKAEKKVWDCISLKALVPR